ncbi:MAG: transcriptional regulator GlxA family with amidase domain [Paracoccaceae bacterium]|jgi:transcriptional regulator GlxA family with amidase domain
MQIELDPNSSEVRLSNHAIFVVVPRFNLTTLVTMIETMRIANYLLPAPVFSWEIVSFDGVTSPASNGMQISCKTDIEAVGAADLIFVLGSWGTEHYDNRTLTNWLRKRYRQGGRVCAVELGCYIVARAGLLDGKAATTHWSWLSGFQESFDKIKVSEQLFTIQNRVMTCAGGFAGVDLMLRLIETSHGAGLSGEIADQMMHHPIRSDVTPQRRTMSHGTETMIPVVRQAISLIENNIEEPLSVPKLAEELAVSQRQLERQFKKYIGCSVVQFGLMLRLQNARVLLISTDLGVREIATASGFNTLSHFAFSFGKFFGRRPSEYRESWPQDATTPSWPGTMTEFLASLQTKQNKKGH